MKRREGRLRWLGNAGTTLVLALAIGLLVRDRVLPALADRAAVDPGERVPDDLRVVAPATGDTASLRDLAPATILAVLPSCPACTRSAPAWRDALSVSRRPLHVLILGGEADGWVDEHLPGATALVPADGPELLDRLRIRIVPTVLALSSDGRLRERVEGVLSPDRIAALLEPDGAVPSRTAP